MTPQALRTALHRGQRVYGTLIVSDSPRWPAAVAQIGLDFVFIDTEHIALDRKELSWMCQTYAALGLPPIVRIPAPDPYAATMVLDAGAAGVMVPYVETVEQIKTMHGAVKLRPLKGARLDAVLHRGAKLKPELSRYQKAQYGENILIINIESQPAIDNLDALLAVEGLDGVLIGPHDLSSSLGVPERYDAPEFDAAVRLILRRARAHGVGAGMYCVMGTDRAISWTRDGLNLIVQSGDIIAMRESLSADIATLRSALGDGALHRATGTDNL
ncbi:MAG: aldolase [Opitutus sp.]|nr:aldolase [Opitutus sp.]